MDGILNIDKAAGMTSYRVVSLVKRLSEERRVGHAGTLDPAATGVLPVCIGQGTRVIEFMMDADKSYRAEIELGVSTDTYDAEGKVIRRSDPSGVTRAEVEEATAFFRGSIEQIPPAYSALKYQGKPMYELARAGISVELKSRRVSIYRLELTDWQPPVVEMDVVCSKGTYIRSLAHDLGEALGCGAYLKSLRRTRCGQFDINEAVPLPELEMAFRAGDLHGFLLPIDCVLQSLPRVVVNDEECRAVKNGRALVIESVKGRPPFESIADVSEKAFLKHCCRAYTADGRFLAVLRLNTESGFWQPEKVFL